MDPAGPGTNWERVLPRAAKLMDHGDIQVNLSGFTCVFISTRISTRHGDKLGKSFF